MNMKWIHPEQLSSRTILIDDFNNDGLSDVMLGGNRTSVQTDQGVYDASIGQVLLGKSNGEFISLDPMASGFIVKGLVRDIARVNSGNEKKFIVTRNNDAVLTFRLKWQPINLRLLITFIIK